MTKLLNDPADAVRESLEGVVLLHPGTALLTDRLIVVRADRVVHTGNRSDVPVALISGGGAGHEPAHAGYVADGMLTAAVSGEVFASPGVDSIVDAIRAVTGDAGCLLIVKSYTGDRLNFGLAAEIARSEGLQIEAVVVADDVAIAESDANAGRRGLAGTVLVHKAAGAAAAAGASLAEVVAVARSVATSVGTIGVGLSGVTLPGAHEPGFRLAPGEIEVGLGIHGEPGVVRDRVRGADGLVADLLDRILNDRGLRAGDRVVALVGSAGATSWLELNVVSRGVAATLAARGIDLARLWRGPVLTSLDMAGISLTLLPLPAGDAGQDLLALLDAPTASLAWPGRTPSRPHLRTVEVPAAPPATTEAAGAHDAPVRHAVDAACRALLAAEPELTGLDQVVGDGDLGMALARGARAWLAEPVEGPAPLQLRALSAIARRVIGGTSGPLYAVGLLRAAESLAADADWAEAFAAGTAAIAELGGAQVGDRTMVDALAPAVAATPQGVAEAVSAAAAGADSTRTLTARRGRSSYLGDRVQGVPDPGAVAVTVWLSAVRDAIAAETGQR